MRVPKISVYNTDIDKEIMELQSYDYARKFYNLGKEKDKNKFINTVESLVRGSMEYKDELIPYLKNGMRMDKCSFLRNISRNKAGKAKFRIEIHHEPFTLYDIVSVVLNKRLDEDESVDMFDICEEVMRLHFSGEVGLIPLSQTAHELVHAGKLFIPLQFIDIGFNDFFNTYKETIKGMDGLVDMLEAKVKLSKEYETNREEFVSILRKKFIYVVEEGRTAYSAIA